MDRKVSSGLEANCVSVASAAHRQQSGTKTAARMLSQPTTLVPSGTDINNTIQASLHPRSLRSRRRQVPTRTLRAKVYEDYTVCNNPTGGDVAMTTITDAMLALMDVN